MGCARLPANGARCFDDDDGVVDDQAGARVMPNSVSVLMEKPAA